MRTSLKLGFTLLLFMGIAYMIVFRTERHGCRYTNCEFQRNSLRNLSLVNNIREMVKMCSDNVIQFVENIQETWSVSAELLQHVDACRRYNLSKISNCLPDTNSFKGRIHPDMSRTSVQELRRSHVLKFVHQGGWIYPSGCLPRHSIALIIPFRNRETHLPVLLRQLLPIIHKQNGVHVRVFVIDQVDEEPFNRGKACNIGFLEALKLFPFTCFIFHDVDLIPEDDRIPYDCVQTPMHLSVAISKFNYTLKYSTSFGGIVMFTKDQFLDVDGFPNTFWGWGGEDDNLYERVFLRKSYQLLRPPADVARYMDMQHGHASENYKDWNIIGPNVDFAKDKFDQDGVKNIQYDVVEMIEHEFYTRIKVDMKRKESAFYEEFEKFRKQKREWRLP